MKLLLRTNLWLMIIGLCFGQHAQAQMSRNNNKSSNPYRKSYQRMAAGTTVEASFEIRGGTLWAWGINTYYQLGDGTTTRRTSPVQIGTDNKWVSVAAGQYHTMALKSDGTLWGWGYGGYGSLGDGTSGTKVIPTQIGTDTKWVSIATGALHTVALKSDGTLWACGYNAQGPLGDGTTSTNYSFVQIGTDTKWVSVAAGQYHTMALKSDGTLWTWGYNGGGQLGNGNTSQQNSPVQIGTSNNWVNVAGGTNHTVALKSDGTLWAWGNNFNGQIGDGTGNNTSIPIQIGTDTKWASITAGFNHTVALKSDGTLWGWGSNSSGQLGDGSTANRYAPVQVGTDTKWVSVAGGNFHTIGLKSDGTLYTWGFNAQGELGDGTIVNKSNPVQVRNSNRDWLQVTQGYLHTVGLKSDGTLWAWGMNDYYGSLGDGTTADRSTPVQVGTDNKWVSTTAGSNHTIGLKSDGTLWAWGNNGSGQVGDNSTTNRTSPIQIGTDTKWISIAGGGNHSLGLKSDGTLWAWGRNDVGQLGDGTTANRGTPVQIGTDTKWVSIAGGGNHTLGLKSDGTLWAWGYNYSGQLGDGTTADKSTPVQVGTDNKWVSMAAGSAYTIGLKSDGTLWAWGDNSIGQLGDGGITISRTSPVQIGTDTKWMNIAAANAHTMGLKSDGTLWTWGDNYRGTLGDGTNVDKSSPAQITSQTNVIGIGKMSISLHSAILKSDRAAICMTGYNGNGQLGDGTTTQTNSLNCSNNICRAYSLPTVATSTYTQTVAGTGNRTDFQGSCTLTAAVTASGTTPVTGSVTAIAINDASVQTSGQAYVTRHYDIVPAANANTATATITLYFTQAEFTAYNAANGTVPDLPANPTDATGISNLRVTQFHGTPTGGYAPANYPTTWGGSGPARVVLTPTSVIWNAEDSRWEVAINVTGFSGFFVHGNSPTPLPLVTGSFVAKAVNKSDVLLSWDAYNPHNDGLYEVERSADGRDFTAIGSVKPATATEYSLHDYRPLTGRSYYRLKVRAISGETTYSAVREVYINAEGAVVQVYPSPAKDYIVVEHSTGAVSGSLIDIQGSVLMHINTKSGEHIPVSALPAGLYLLRLADGGTFKIVKE